MKKIAIFLSVLFGVLLFGACGGSTDTSGGENSGGSNTEPEKPADKIISAVDDAEFKKGFDILGLDSALDGNTAKSTIRLDRGTINWKIAQWFSVNDLNDAFPIVNVNMMKIEDLSKKVELDRVENALTLELNASKEYKETANSRVKWAHLLIEQQFSDDFSSHRLTEFERLEATLDFNVTKAVKSPLETNEKEKILPAQFLQYFYVVNNNPQSQGYGNFLWFGLGYLDTRYDVKQLSHLRDYAGGNPGNYIYCLGADATIGDEPFEIGRDYKVNIDILPYIEKGIERAQEGGFMLNTSISDCVITGMNIGWEVVGIWDVSVTFSNVSFIGKLK